MPSKRLCPGDRRADSLGQHPCRLRTTFHRSFIPHLRVSESNLQEASAMASQGWAKAPDLRRVRSEENKSGSQQRTPAILPPSG